MSNYRIIFILLSILLFFACESSSIMDNNNIVESDVTITSSSINYNAQENEISIYVEVSDSQNILSIDADIKNDTTLIETIPLLQSNLNASNFLYQGDIDFSDDAYVYGIDFIINFFDGLQDTIPDIFSIPIEPEIIGYTVPDTFQLDSTDWTWLPIDIEILNLNGADNISSVTYRVQRFNSGCDINECIYDTYYDNTPDVDCNDPINDMTYISDPTWIFEYVSSSNFDQTHRYHIDIPMRPLNGAALYYNGECDDNNNDGICDNFEIADCGRTGIVLFEFTVIDQDGLIDQIIDIPLEITE